MSDDIGRGISSGWMVTPDGVFEKDDDGNWQQRSTDPEDAKHLTGLSFPACVLRAMSEANETTSQA